MTVTASHEMVERVSAAIRLSDYSHLPARAIAREIARVAIEAMREPTDRMMSTAFELAIKMQEAIDSGFDRDWEIFIDHHHEEIVLAITQLAKIDPTFKVSALSNTGELMVERVSRAICSATNIAMEGVTEVILDNPDFVIPAHKRTDGKALARWQLYVTQARAAIAAVNTGDSHG